MSDPIGQTIGSYALESRIGAGPNGQVYQARQVRLNRPAAVKLLAQRFSSDPTFSQRFSAAMQRVATLRHPGIADIEDFGEHNGQGYIAMELYEEGSLRTFLQRRIRQSDPWDLGQVLEIVRQAAEGLHAAHSLGVVHGHLKPENILLQRRGPGTAESYRARVGDFGLLEIANNAPITTLAYTTPEQTRGESPTPQSDIYALGVVLYEVSTGYVPFAVKTAEEAAQKHGRAQPVPPRAVRQQLPAELEQVILRCLEKQSERRYASAAELAAALAPLVRTASPGQTVLLTDLPTQSIPRQPAQATQPLQLDPSQQPTVRMPVDPSQQPTVRAASPPAGNLPQVQLLDAQGNLIRSVDLDTNGVILGRASDSALVLDHEQISRQHARIDWNGQQATITDLGSANGTQLDGMRLPPSAPVPWSWNQRARVGPFTLQLVPAQGMAVQPPTQRMPDPLLQGLLGNTSATPANDATRAFGGANLGILLDQEQMTLAPGQRATLNLTLTNNGTTTDTTTVSVEGVPGMWIGVPNQAVQVPPGGRVPLALSIGVPRSADSLAGDYAVIVRARSGANPTQSATARGRWTVLPFAASSLNITPRRAQARRDATYQVTVRNDGNQTETFLLQADDDAQELQYTFSEDSVTLDPNETTTVALTVYGRGKLIGGSATIPFHVSAQAGDERPQAQTAQFIRESRIPLALTLVLATLLGLALLFFLLNNRNQAGGVVATATTTAIATLVPSPTPTTEPGAPVVDQFTIDPPVVQPGQIVTILWSVSGADSVDINVIGTGLPPQGQGQYVVNQTTDIVLTANGGGKTTQRVAQAVIASPVPATATVVAPTETAAPSATAVPASPTAVPASPTALPPSPTALPPSPTVVPASATPAPAPQPLNLINAARDATWSNNTAEDVPFGEPDENVQNGGWADTQSLAQLENNRPYLGPLYTVPVSGTGGFIAGTYNVPSIGQQRFLAEVGFSRNTGDTTTARVQIFLNGEVIFEADKTADGNILPIDVDLAPFAGSGATLVLRVENVSNPDNVGLYWVRPRVDER